MKVSSLCALICLSLVACAAPPAHETAIRLVDVFPDATVEGQPESAASETGGWRFDGEGDHGWQVGSGITDLAVRDGHLTGRSSDDFPIVYVERDPSAEGDDLLHAVELRMRVSAGEEVSVAFEDDEELEIGKVLGQARTFPWSAKTALEPGDEVRTYLIRPTSAVAASSTRHLMVRPTDAAEADFAIESARLIFRKEHLASTPAGIGWHAMSDVYRETLTTHVAETVRFSLTLPSRPWLDVGLATIDNGPMTFRVAVARGNEEQTVLERTVTTPHRWQPVAVDLADYAGSDVTLSFSTSSALDVASAFWGSPAIRHRGLPAEGAPQKVVIILGDTLRRDHLDAWGYERPTAPRLAALAQDGVRAADAISQATWTKVSVPSIFTSLYPLTHGVRDMPDRLPASATTMAEVFREAGYATLGTSSVPFNGRATNLHQGYEEFHESASLPEGLNAKTARTYVDRVTDWLERHRDTPSFVLLHVFDPHSPYLPKKPYDTVWGEPGDQEEYKRQQDLARPKIQHPLMQRFGMPERQALLDVGLDPEKYVELQLDAYDGSIRGMDVEIGRLLERLDELGLIDDTLLAFVSDHGTEFLDHDQHFHGHSVYGELNRVPFMLWGQGVPSGVVIPHTVQTLDLMPTVLELAGLEAPEGMQGQSLVPFFAAEGSDKQRPRPAFTEKAYSGDPNGPKRGFAEESYSIVLDGWKLIHNPRRQGDFPEYELFDHVADPLNHNNLADQHPERVEQLSARLDAWRESATAARLASDAELGEGMSAEDLERLRSLGYVQ